MVVDNAPEASVEAAIAVVGRPPAPAGRRGDVAALLAGLVTVTLWGSSFVAIRAADKTMSPGAIALGRLLVSSAVLGAVALARREPLPSRRDIARIGAYGILWLGVYSVALNEAERRIDAGAAAMLIGTGPLLIVLLAGVFLREGFPRRLFAGCALAFAGSSVMGFATSQAGSRADSGIALCLIAVSCLLGCGGCAEKVAARVSALQVTWLGCVAATVACLPFVPMLLRDAAEAGAIAIASTALPLQHTVSGY